MGGNPNVEGRAGERMGVREDGEVGREGGEQGGRMGEM